MFKLFRALGLRHLVVVDNHNQVSSQGGQRAPFPAGLPALATGAQVLSAGDSEAQDPDWPYVHLQVSPSLCCSPHMFPQRRSGATGFL